MKRILSFLTLMGSSATLICCVLPALFVFLGFGATFASLMGAVPQLTWFSEHKSVVFGGAAGLLLLAGYVQWRNRTQSCPIDPKLAEACRNTRGFTSWLFLLSLCLYIVGAFFAFLAPRF